MNGATDQEAKLALSLFFFSICVACTDFAQKIKTHPFRANVGKGFVALFGLAIIVTTSLFNNSLTVEGERAILLTYETCKSSFASSIALSFGNVSSEDYVTACKWAKLLAPVVQYELVLYLVGAALMVFWLFSPERSEEKNRKIEYISQEEYDGLTDEEKEEYELTKEVTREKKTKSNKQSKKGHMKFCHVCGEKLRSEGEFCSSCGKKIK